jgi:hypothetical protein
MVEFSSRRARQTATILTSCYSGFLTPRRPRTGWISTGASLTIMRRCLVASVFARCATEEPVQNNAWDLAVGVRVPRRAPTSLEVPGGSGDRLGVAEGEVATNVPDLQRASWQRRRGVPGAAGPSCLHGLHQWVQRPPSPAVSSSASTAPALGRHPSRCTHQAGALAHCSFVKSRLAWSGSAARWRSPEKYRGRHRQVVMKLNPSIPNAEYITARRIGRRECSTFFG